jgi:hypothetical protein
VAPRRRYIPETSLTAARGKGHINAMPQVVPLFMLVPFAWVLASIALLPQWKASRGTRHRNQALVMAVLAAIADRRGYRCPRGQRWWWLTMVSEFVATSSNRNTLATVDLVSSALVVTR